MRYAKRMDFGAPFRQDPPPGERLPRRVPWHTVHASSSGCSRIVRMMKRFLFAYAGFCIIMLSGSLFPGPGETAQSPIAVPMALLFTLFGMVAGDVFQKHAPTRPVLAALVIALLVALAAPLWLSSAAELMHVSSL
jgi:hypothetical protein